MYFVALATDYDGTIAEDGVVAEATLEALRELKQSGRKLLLVTGRELPDLKKVFPEIALFDLVVAENGGILFDPKTSEETLLAPEPPQVFLDRLQAREVPVPSGVGAGLVPAQPAEGRLLCATSPRSRAAGPAQGRPLQQNRSGPTARSRARSIRSPSKWRKAPTSARKSCAS